MNPKKLPEILELRTAPLSIRNVSILAHVDHGKTSLSDSLLSSNQIISPALAGKLRYLDSRPDEQERLITMKSSSISLIYDGHLVNIIDSPGHVDFSSEVAAALRVCDGGILLIDVVEGMCPQTYTVLKQSWDEGISLCLVFNKLDRLISQMRMSPSEAYGRLMSLLGQVNAVVSGLFSEQKLRNGLECDYEQEEQFMFKPETGNVAFCSALDRWAFTLKDFSLFYSKKMGFNPRALCTCLWGEHYYKGKKVLKKPPTEKSTQMFVQFVLEPIWKVYSCIQLNPNRERFEGVLGAIGVTVNPRELSKFDSDPRGCLQAVLSTWLPIDKSVLSMIIQQLPTPIQAQQTKAPIIAPRMPLDLRGPFLCCEREGPVSAFISKMMPIDPAVHITRSPGESALGHDSLVAFCRVFSGTLTPNMALYLIESKGAVLECSITHIYQLMGQYLTPVDSAPAGNIVGLGGLQNIVYKSATLSSVPNCPSFSPLAVKATPIVKVAVSTASISDMTALARGLSLLDRSDNSVETYMQDNGEHILVTCGEVHLQRCIKDLEETFAQVAVCVSEPIVSFKETVSGQGAAREDSTPNGRCRVKVSAFPLPDSFVEFLDLHKDAVRAVYGSMKQAAWQERESLNFLLNEALEALPPQHKGLVLSHLQAFGPKRCGNCLLLHLGKDSLLSRELAEDSDSEQSENGSTSTSRLSTQELDLHSALVSGFELAANSGPLCGELLHGVCLVLEEVSISSEESKDPYGPFHGQVISTMKDACRSAVMANAPRLVESLYACNFSTTQEFVGRLYAVLSRRRGRITEEVLQDGTTQFACNAELPVAESFGFADELRRMTSGSVTPQLVFSHWKMMPEDPFYVPSTEEELEAEGDSASLENLPKRYVNQVRTRKGLPTDQKLVVHAEKQRNMTKMK